MGSPVVCITKMKYLLCILGLVFIVRQSLGIEQTTALRRALLAGYEKDAKPDGKVETKVGLRVTTMDLCAHRQALTSTVWLEMMWTDRRLVWDPQIRRHIQSESTPRTFGFPILLPITPC